PLQVELGAVVTRRVGRQKIHTAFESWRETELELEHRLRLLNQGGSFLDGRVAILQAQGEVVDRNQITRRNGVQSRRRATRDSAGEAQQESDRAAHLSPPHERAGSAPSGSTPSFHSAPGRVDAGGPPPNRRGLPGRSPRRGARSGQPGRSSSPASRRTRSPA